MMEVLIESLGMNHAPCLQSRSPWRACPFTQVTNTAEGSDSTAFFQIKVSGNRTGVFTQNLITGNHLLW